MLPDTHPKVMVLSDAQAADVAVTPLNVASWSFRSKTLVQSSPDLLLIRPSVGYRLFSFMFVFLGTVAILVGLAAVFGQIKNIQGASPTTFGLCFAGIGLLFASIGLGLICWTKTFGFDRRRGILTDGKKTWRLADILAVQLLFGGRHSSSDNGSYLTYQLNLVFKDAEKSRVNISNADDQDWTRKTGAQLAEFLKVPLLDHIETK